LSRYILALFLSSSNTVVRNPATKTTLMRVLQVTS
jgi:hypothetical protein